MGTKYTSNSASGFDATPPSDDGSVTEANKVKWATIKSKLATPVKDLADTINTDLTTHFDRGPTALTTSTTLGADHFNDIIQVSGSGVTLTLSDAATLAAGWFCDIINTDSSNSVTIGRATASDTFNGTTADETLYPLESIRIFVSAATSGFYSGGTNHRAGLPYSGANTLSGVNTFSTGQKFTQGLGPDERQNYSLSASVAAKALTVALKGNNESDPSATNVVEMAFRSTTATTGTSVIRNIEAATSIVVPSGATLGFTNAEASVIYVYLCDDGSTRELGVSKAMFSESDIQATTAITTGADSASVLYTTSTFASAAIRFIGVITIQTGAVAGEWDNEDTQIELPTVCSVPSTRITGTLTSSQIGTDAVGQTQIAASAVGQGELKSTTSEQSASLSPSASGLITLTGATYTLWFESKATGGTGAYSISFATNTSGTYTSPMRLTNDDGVTSQIVYCQSRYIQASPPYDFGDGEIPLFAYLLIDNTTGAIVATSFAADPPWAYHGPRFKAKQKKFVTPFDFKDVGNDPAKMQAYLNALTNPTRTAKQILTPAQAMIEKMADQVAVPHPFAGMDLTERTITLVEPAGNFATMLAVMMENGESLSEIAHAGHFIVDNTPVTAKSPPGVQAVRARFKLTQ